MMIKEKESIELRPTRKSLKIKKQDLIALQLQATYMNSMTHSNHYDSRPVPTAATTTATTEATIPIWDTPQIEYSAESNNHLLIEHKLPKIVIDITSSTQRKVSSTLINVGRELYKCFFNRGQHCVRISLILLLILLQLKLALTADIIATTPMDATQHTTERTITHIVSDKLNFSTTNSTKNLKDTDRKSWSSDSLVMRLAKRFSTGNELWDGIIRDCYNRPTFTCFQKNVYAYLNDAFNAGDVNITERFKFYKNNVDYKQLNTPTTTESKQRKTFRNDADNFISSHDDQQEEPLMGRASK